MGLSSYLAHHVVKYKNPATATGGCNGITNGPHYVTGIRHDTTIEAECHPYQVETINALHVGVYTCEGSVVPNEWVLSLCLPCYRSDWPGLCLFCCHQP